jgi:type I restriction enzyme, S subunit
MASLAGVCESVRYGYTASATKDVTGTKFLRVTDIATGSVDWDGVPNCKISAADYSRHRLLVGDIVIARMGTIGVSAIIRESVQAVAASYLVRFRIDQSVAAPEYVAYVLRSQLFSDYVWTHGSAGAVQPNINARVLGEFRFPLPAMARQKEIARILGSLDDKIELNHRTSETTEAMARAIFASWFIDDAPAEWTVRGLDEVARFLNGLALQKFPPTAHASLPVIKIAQLRSGDTSGADRASADLPADYIVQDGDVLFSWSGSLECVLWAGGKGALNQHLFKVTSAEFPKWFYYFWIHEHLADFREIASGKATTMGHIQRYHLADAKVSVPPPEVLASADRVLGPMVEQISQRRVQARTLAEVRDALLPRLLAGEFVP